MIEKGHARFQAPSHGHVIHPLDGVVHDQSGDIQAQHFIEIVLSIRFGQASGDQFGGMVGTVISRGDRLQPFSVLAVEIMPAKPLQVGAGLGDHARVPKIAAEHLVRALAALHHLDRSGDALGQQEKRHGVLPDHRLGHTGNRFRQPFQHLGIGDQVLVMAGLIAGGHLVGILELAAFLLRLIFETDREGQQIPHAGFGQQSDQQAGIQSAGQQHADRHVSDVEPPPHRQSQRRVNGFGPLGFAPRFGRTDGAQPPVDSVAFAAVGVDGEGGRGRQLADASQDRARGRNDGVEGQLVV